MKLNIITLLIPCLFSGCTGFYSIGKQFEFDEVIVRKYKSKTDLPPELMAIIKSLAAQKQEPDTGPMAGSGYISLSDKDTVASRANRRCEICFTDLYPGGCFIGEYAHIKGERPGSARHDPNLADTQAADNLLLICPNCHTQIDKCPADWPVEFLEFCKHRSTL